MGRALFQVLVLPFRMGSGGEYEFAVFRVADGGYWQGIAGGGEEGEGPWEAARREAWEEGGIAPEESFYRLSCVGSVPVDAFVPQPHWPDNVYVVPEYAFGVRVDGGELRISGEHTAFLWTTYEEARQRLRWDSNRTALWELRQRLTRNDLQLTDEERLP